MDKVSKFFPHLIRKQIFLCIRKEDFRLTCNMLLYYHVKFENPKMLLSFTN